MIAGRSFISRFSPNRTAPAVLEAIFVQRHKLAEVWLERLRDSVLTGVKHHLLAVGPRGCGKSHLVALLVSRLRKDPAVRERARIAWLPEDETTPSFWKFLLRILRALNAEYGAEFPLPLRDQVADATDDRRSTVLSDYLLKMLDGRTLLVVVENLDDVMRGLKAEGQKRWRAFLQEHPVAATLATSQQLTEDVSDRDRPFFNFFQIEHLQPLSADDALNLLRRIAEHTENSDLAQFLQTPVGRARVRAIRHLAGGSHRAFIILSEFATRENLDDLVTAFEELLDELTPYYQERLRWLPGQQREIVEFLCRQARTVPVKEIAGELFLTEQTVAAQLKQLKDKGYVIAGSVGRESRYELAEPLMRLCVEVKDQQREPIQLIVAFLRVWYDRTGVEARLQCLAADAELERRYYRAVLQAQRPDIPSPVEEALDRDLKAACATGDQEEVVRVLVLLAATVDSAWRCAAVANELRELSRHAEALAAYERVTELEPNDTVAWGNKGHTLDELGRHAEALAAYERAIELNSNDALAWNDKGYTLDELGRHAEALAAYERAIELHPTFVSAWIGKGIALYNLGQYAEALAACDRAIELDPKNAIAWSNKQVMLYNLERHGEAVTACDRAIELHPKFVNAWIGKGAALHKLGRHAEALAVCDRAIELDPKFAYGWDSRGWVKLGLGQIGEAADDFRHAVELNGNHAGAFEGLAETYVLQGNWTEAERLLSRRFRLPLSPYNPARSWHLPDLIVTIFRSSTDRIMCAHGVSRLVDIAREAQEDWEQRKALDNEKPPPSPADARGTPAPPNPFALIGDALVRSLMKKAYAEASADTLNAWADAWREVAERHPHLSLSARLFAVGVRYLQTQDERVLLDLVQEERSILRDLFGLDDRIGEG